jgi:hypothetical protein
VRLSAAETQTRPRRTSSAGLGHCRRGKLRLRPSPSTVSCPLRRLALSAPPRPPPPPLLLPPPKSEASGNSCTAKNPEPVDITSPVRPLKRPLLTDTTIPNMSAGRTGFCCGGCVVAAAAAAAAVAVAVVVVVAVVVAVVVDDDEGGCCLGADSEEPRATREPGNAGGPTAPAVVVVDDDEGGCCFGADSEEPRATREPGNAGGPTAPAVPPPAACRSAARFLQNLT